MKIKTTVYVVLLAIAISLNIYHYRKYFHEGWMRYKLRHETIVISMSTTPYRINKLKDTLDSIFAQNFTCKMIYLSVPYKFKRDNIDYVIPEEILNDKRITILRTDDYGPGTKLLGVLEKADLPANTIIVTLDDDVIYPPNLVLQLAYRAQQYPDRAIGLMGANPDYDADGNIPENSELGILKTSKPDAMVSILQGYTGVAYRRYFFDQTIFDLAHAPRDCVNSDDLYISFYLAKHKIPRQVLRNEYINACKVNWQTETGTDQNALHQLSRTPTEKHRSCIAHMKQQDANVLF